MKTLLQIKHLLVVLIAGTCVMFSVSGQIMYIPKVPDLQQPIDPWWGNLPDNSCAPVSAANICVFWDDSVHHSNADSLNSNLIADSIPSYLSYFMGTNGLGDPTRANPFIFGPTNGTITMDIDTGFIEYVRWDTSNMFYTPKPFVIPIDKKGYNWKIETDISVGFDIHMTEMDSLRPDIVIFKYWNPDSTGYAVENELTGDSIYFYLWDTATTVSNWPDPHEDWYFDEKDQSAGHAVTGVGYLENIDPDLFGPLPLANWIICHDNWSTTPKDIAIPWVDSLWIATITADPGHDTIPPYISCIDTTVYLDSNGQFNIDDSYVIDSVWDNNGYVTTYLNNYLFTCSHTETPQTVIAAAYDVYSNLSYCVSSVTVVDTITPLASCRDTIIYLDITGNTSIDSSFVNDNSSDNCEISSIILNKYDFNCEDVGNNSIEVTVTDVNSNSSVCQAVVTVSDTIKPIALCKDTSIYLDETGDVIIDSSFVNNGSSDICGISSITLNQLSFTCVDIGLNNVTATVSDRNGNTSECYAVITVYDSIKPVIICTDATIYLNQFGNYIIDSTYLLSEISDNCGFDSIRPDKNVFTKSDAGSSQQIQIIAYDHNGNQNKCQSTVTILDTVSTNIKLKGNLTLFNVYSISSQNTFVIQYNLPEKDNVYLAVYTIEGIKIDIVINEMQNNGTHKIIWNPDVTLPEGVYLFEFKTKNIKMYKKILHVD